MTPFVDTTRTAPCPIESCLSDNLARHLELLVSWRCLEIVHYNSDDLFEQRFVGLPLMRKCGVAVESFNFFHDRSVIDMCGHG